MQTVKGHFSINNNNLLNQLKHEKIYKINAHLRTACWRNGGGATSVKAERVYASPSNGTQTWTAGTNTFTWNATGNNFINTGLPIGDITAYTNFHCTVSNFSENASFIRLVLKNGKNPQITESINSGECNIDLVSKYPDWDFTCVTDFLLFGSNSATDGHSIDGEHPASVVVTDIYLEKPNTLTFDATGKAVVNKTALTATGGLSYNPTTGDLSSDGTAGALTLEFATPVDLKNLFHFNVTHTGSTGDILTCLEFYDKENAKINTWNSIKLSNTWNENGIDDNATNAFLNNKPVKKLVWRSDAKASNNGKTANITSVEFICKTIACSKAGETPLNTLPWNKKDGSGTEHPVWNMNTVTDTYYGNGSSDPTHFVDLTAYDELRIYRDNNVGFRAFFINAAGGGTNNISISNATWNSEKKYWSIDLSKVETWNSKVALKSIKSASYGVYDVVRNIVAFKTPAANAPQYVLTGSGMLLPETEAALADETVTSIDATGVTGITTNSEKGRTPLESANPNCLFLGKVGVGYLSNTKNVIDGDVCANLELTDSYPYKAPVDFTATNAMFKKTVSDAGYATMMIPFGTDLSGVEAFDLTAVNGETITSSSVDAIAANSPVMIKATAGDYEFTASNVSIAATANGEVTNGLLKGGYATMTAAADANNYVLQNNANGVNFYLVTETAATVKPFRAYLKASGAGARALNLDLGETTGIETVKKADVTTAVYSLSGQRVAAPQKGLYIVNGKKVIVK